jgi:hypothetical protein
MEKQVNGALRPDERFAARGPQVWFSDEHGVVQKEKRK